MFRSDQIMYVSCNTSQPFSNSGVPCHRKVLSSIAAAKALYKNIVTWFNEQCQTGPKELTLTWDNKLVSYSCLIRSNDNKKNYLREKIKKFRKNFQKLWKKYFEEKFGAKVVPAVNRGLPLIGAQYIRVSLYLLDSNIIVLEGQDQGLNNIKEIRGSEVELHFFIIVLDKEECQLPGIFWKCCAQHK